MTDTIPREIVLALHERTISRFGDAHGVRDEGLLDAAISQPWQTFDGVDLYPTIEEKAARLSFEIITQHPFVDGNKRTGALLLGVLLRRNGARFKPKPGDYLEIIMDVASGAKGYEELLEFVRRETISDNPKQGY